MNSSYEFFLPHKYPLIIKNKINEWPLLRYSRQQWCELFKDTKLTFRQGNKNVINSPQWESTCSSVELTMDEFFTKSEGIQNDWLYFDYKAMGLVFEENCDILNGVSWGSLDFPELSGKDSSLWIGNNGAHTPCHMDTYGYNLVAQIYGRKQWLLMPQEETCRMRATRVPYEESSIYSGIDFFSRTEDLLSLEKVYRIVLEPGDVLIVPPHWWHYVENLDVAISINTWIPTTEDDEARLEEALVQRFIWTIMQELTEDNAKALLNPNEYNLLEEAPDDNILVTVSKKCLQSRLDKQIKKSQDTLIIDSQLKLLAESVDDKDISCNSPKCVPPQKMPRLEISDEVSQCHSQKVTKCLRVKEEDLFRPIPLTRQELAHYVEEKSRKLNCKRCTTIKEDDTYRYAKMLTNSFCHPETICVAKEKFLDIFQTYNAQSNK